MRAPTFWLKKRGRESAPVMRTLLTPISWLYARIVAKRIKNTKSYDPGVPVICVGNATLGGTGKTPIAAYLIQSLSRTNPGAVILSRGYGGRQKGPLVVGPKHTPDEVGDEPILLSRHGTVWIAAGRDDGAKAAVAHGARVIIMDDGHQNPLLKKTLSLLVVDAETGFGNERVFPAGPLREPIKAAMERTDGVILMQPFSGYETDQDLLAHFKGKPVIRAYLKATTPPPKGKLFAFAGIGRPNKFFDGLKRDGGDVVEGIGYGDHHKYSEEDLKSLVDLSSEYGAKLVTTEKDYVRLPRGYKRAVTAYPVEVHFEDELSLRRLLHPIIERIKTR